MRILSACLHVCFGLPPLLGHSDFGDSGAERGSGVPHLRGGTYTSTTLNPLIAHFPQEGERGGGQL